MARRHEDRKPGQRFARGAGKGPAKGGKPGGGKPGFGKSGGGKPGSGKPGADKFGSGKPGSGKAGSGKAGSGKPGMGGGRPRAFGSRGSGSRGSAPHTAPRRPTGGSRRRAEGLVVTPSKVLGQSEGSRVEDGKVRLNHFLAKAGVCSRRMADELIEAGRVEVNGEPVTELGVRIDPATDDVRFDGSRLQAEKAVYVLINKPKGVVCTNARHEQKKRVVDLLPTIRGRIFTVGRLDMDSEGLLLVTNDGAFAQEMTHPRYGVPKLYSVVVRGRVEDAALDKARGGVWLSEGPTGGMQLKIDRLTKERTYLKVTLREGKNREIRRVFAKLGHPVVSLKRVRIGPLNLHGLGDGDWRFLGLEEVAQLREAALSEDGEVDAPPIRQRPQSGPRRGGARKHPARKAPAPAGWASSGRPSSGRPSSSRPSSSRPSSSRPSSGRPSSKPRPGGRPGGKSAKTRRTTHD